MKKVKDDKIIGRVILQTSMVMQLFELVYKKYRLFEERLNEVFKYSILYVKIKILFNGIIIIFQYSFLGKITEIKEEGNLKEILKNSRFIKSLSKICRNWRNRTIGYLKTCFTINYAIGLRNELYSLPVKAGSFIVVTAILSNIFFCALFKNAILKEIGSLGWMIKGMLLFVGLAGLFCEVSLKDLISTSLFLKWMNHNRQSDFKKE